jgi:hypothetical protein
VLFISGVALIFQSVDESGVLRSSAIIVPGPICPFMYSNVCFIKLGILTFGAYIFFISS